MAGVVSSTSPMSRGRTSRMVNGRSRVDGGLIDQHHGNVVLDRISPPARVAAKTSAFLDEANRCLAYGADEDIEQGLINGHDGNIRGKTSRNRTRRASVPQSAWVKSCQQHLFSWVP